MRKETYLWSPLRIERALWEGVHGFAVDGGREGEDDVVGDGDEGEDGKERLRTLKSVGGARAKTRTGCYLPFLTLSQRAVVYEL